MTVPVGKWAGLLISDKGLMLNQQNPLVVKLNTKRDFTTNIAMAFYLSYATLVTYVAFVGLCFFCHHTGIFLADLTTLNVFRN